MLDAGAGLRLGGITLPATGNRATAMPSPMLLAAAFDPALAARYGRTVADEVRQVGGNVLLGPNGDMIRVPWWGRANETEGEDPLLTSRVVGPYVRAVKERGVIADLKHYNLYTQEINRGAPYDARADERTIQEIYTPPWKAAVDNGLGSTMCSFNQLNGEYACQNRLLLVDILKRQLGFKGFVLTDFGAAHSTVAVAQQRARHGDRQSRVLHAGDHPGRGPVGPGDDGHDRRARAPHPADDVRARPVRGRSRAVGDPGRRARGDRARGRRGAASRCSRTATRRCRSTAAACSPSR